MMKKNLFVTLLVASLAGAMLMGCSDNAAEATKEVVETEADVTVEDEETPLADAVEEDADAEAVETEEAETEEAAEEDADVAATTLEEYYGEEANMAAINEQLDAMVESLSDYYSDINFEVTGNEVKYVYAFAEGVEVAKEDLDTQMESMESTIDQTKAAIEAEAGVAPEKIVYTYTDVNGEEIASYEY